MIICKSSQVASSGSNLSRLLTSHVNMVKARPHRARMQHDGQSSITTPRPQEGQTICRTGTQLPCRRDMNTNLRCRCLRWNNSGRHNRIDCCDGSSNPLSSFADSDSLIGNGWLDFVGRKVARCVIDSKTKMIDLEATQCIRPDNLSRRLFDMKHPGNRQGQVKR